MQPLTNLSFFNSSHHSCLKHCDGIPLSLVLNHSYLQLSTNMMPGPYLTLWPQLLLLSFLLTRPQPHSPKPLLFWGFYTCCLFPEISFPTFLQDCGLIFQVSTQSSPRGGFPGYPIEKGFSSFRHSLSGKSYHFFVDL